MKPRIRKPVTAVVDEQPRQPIAVAAIGGTPQGWQALHHYIHEFEEVWESMASQERDSFIKAMALFLGGSCAESGAKHMALNMTQHLVRAGFVDYHGQRNNICQAVVTAHTFGQGDQSIN